MPISTGPTTDFNQVTLKWAGVALDGQPCTGKLRLTYNLATPLLDDGDFPVSIYPVELVKDLTTATIQVKDAQGSTVNRTVGYAEWDVPASDDPDIVGFGGTYTIVEALTGNAKGTTRTFVASKDAPGGVIWVNRITSVLPVAGQAVSAVSVADFNQVKQQVSQLTGSGGQFSGTPTDGSVTNAKVASNAAISADKIANGTVNKVYTATEQTKLTNIAAGATANLADATLLSRGSHTGTQSSTTIADFVEAAEDVVGAVAVRMGGTYDDPNGKVTWPSVFPLPMSQATVATGTGQFSVVLPASPSGVWRLLDVTMSLGTTGSTSTVVDVNKSTGSAAAATIFGGTKPTLTSGQSKGYGFGANATVNSFAAGDGLSLDIDNAGTGAANLCVTVYLTS